MTENTTYSSIITLNDNGLTSLKSWVKKTQPGQVSLIHICNPTYSGGRDQDHDSKPAQENNT
jgi:hypothetical protein